MKTYPASSIGIEEKSSFTRLLQRASDMCLAASGRNCSAGVLACEFGRRLVAECANRAGTPS